MNVGLDHLLAEVVEAQREQHDEFLVELEVVRRHRHRLDLHSLAQLVARDAGGVLLVGRRQAVIGAIDDYDLLQCSLSDFVLQ